MNANKTILITAPYFPPEGGGLERYALQVARLLGRDYGWRAVVVCSQENPGGDSVEEMEGVKIYRLARDVRFSNTPIGFGWSGKIRRIIENEKPDVINIHTPVPGLGDIASFAGRDIPQVVTYHTGSMRKGNYLDALILPYERIMLASMLRRARAVICSSDFVRANFLKKYAKKSETITPGVDADLFAPAADRLKRSREVLFVANLEKGQEYKGLKTLLDAMKILQKSIPDIKLIVAGDGSLRSEYENYALQNGLRANVKFRGRLEGEELLRSYREASVFSLPTANDSQPLVILEAMAAGLPVVSTRIGGIPDMVEDSIEGFLIGPNEPRSLADKISLLLRDPQLREKFAKAARARAMRDFSWQERMRRYDEVLERAMGRRHDLRSHKMKHLF